MDTIIDNTISDMSCITIKKCYPGSYKNSTLSKKEYYIFYSDESMRSALPNIYRTACKVYNPSKSFVEFTSDILNKCYSQIELNNAYIEFIYSKDEVADDIANNIDDSFVIEYKSNDTSLELSQVMTYSKYKVNIASIHSNLDDIDDIDDGGKIRLSNPGLSYVRIKATELYILHVYCHRDPEIYTFSSLHSLSTKLKSLTSDSRVQQSLLYYGSCFYSDKKWNLNRLVLTHHTM